MVGSVATSGERATSFGGIASEYDRLRPPPAPEAVDWLVPPGCGVAVDVAAGTGLFTRALHARVGSVIAIEPDERMRAVLASRSPGVVVLDGVGEAIPLDDASVDAVCVSSAWHWMDQERAVPEVARVLRRGGRFGVIWTSRDRTAPWLQELDRIHSAATADPVVEDGRRHRSVIVADDLFARVETASFGYARRMASDDVVEMLTTYSGYITAAPAEKAAVLERGRAVVARHFPGATEIDVPIRSWCWRADRV